MKKSIRFLTLASALLFALSFSVISCSNASGGSSKEKKSEKTEPETPEGNGEEGEGTQTIPAKTMLETPLTVEIIEDSTMTLNNPWLGKLKYKINDGEEHLVVANDLWLTYNYAYIDNLKAGDIITFTVKEDGSGNNPAEPEKFFNIKNSGKYYVYGNVMSLLYVDFKDKKEIKQPAALAQLFQNGGVQIVNHPTKELVLPATKLKDVCYFMMFYGCAGLTKTPELPATELADSCYEGMFKGCTGLTAAPELPATELATRCYNSMFSGCTSLKYIHCPAQLDAESIAYAVGWVEGVSSTGKFVKPAAETHWSRNNNGIPDGWLLYDEDELNDDGSVKDMKTIPLTIRADKNCTVTLYEPWKDKLKYSINGGDYQTVTDTADITINLTRDDRICFRTLTNGSGNTSGNRFNIVCTDECYVYGNVMSLVAADGFKDAKTLTEDMAFASLFMGQTVGSDGDYHNYIKNHPVNELVLPATTLTDACYCEMFKYCEKLTKAPALPATELKNECYHSMFNRCTSLTEAPDLPAQVMKPSCYKQMFYKCSSLENPPTLSAETLADVCYYGMFDTCVKLKSAPALPANELKYNCYGMMFNECIALTQPPALSATILAVSCYSSMFRCCTSLEVAPVLPAPVLVSYCYSGIFQGCIRIRYLKCLATEIPNSATACLDDWLNMGTQDYVNSPLIFVYADGYRDIWNDYTNLSLSGWTLKSESQELQQ